MKALSWSNWETESPGYQTDYCAKPKNPSLLLVSHYSCYDLHVSDSVGIEIVKKIQTLHWE